MQLARLWQLNLERWRLISNRLMLRIFYLREADILRYEDKYLRMGHNYST